MTDAATYKHVYWTLARRLINLGVVTLAQCATIARVRTRKEHYWKRHIRDLCTYALSEMQRTNRHNEDARRVCEAGLKAINDETTPHAP